MHPGRAPILQVKPRTVPPSAARSRPPTIAKRSIMESAEPTVTIPALHQMKRDGTKESSAWSPGTTRSRASRTAPALISSLSETQSASICGAIPIRSKSRWKRCWWCCKAVRRGVRRALVSCDFPFGPLQEGTGQRAARRHPPGQGRRRRHDQARWLPPTFPMRCARWSRAGIPVFAQFGITPQTALQYGIPVRRPDRRPARRPRRR